MFCDNLEWWDGVGGRFKREGTHVYLWLIHVDLWQKLGLWRWLSGKKIFLPSRRPDPWV